MEIIYISHQIHSKFCWLIYFPDDPNAVCTCGEDEDEEVPEYAR